MRNFISRQINLARDVINSYKNGEINLNKAISRYEAILGVLENNELSDICFQYIENLEQINSKDIVLYESEEGDFDDSVRLFNEMHNIVENFYVKEI